MCYSGRVYCTCCGRQYDNGIVAGCGCTGVKCDDCYKHGCPFNTPELIKKSIIDESCSIDN